MEKPGNVAYNGQFSAVECSEEAQTIEKGIVVFCITEEFCEVHHSAVEVSEVTACPGAVLQHCKQDLFERAEFDDNFFYIVD